MANQINKINIDWYEVDRTFSGLGTDIEHEILVRREAIPIIFVPGVMGSWLRLAGTDGTGETNGLPNLRWNPTPGFLLRHYRNATPARRKAMLIGERFNRNYLEVHNTNPIGDGFAALMADYRSFLYSLRTRDWGPIGKLFVFPVYGFGYNWTATNRDSGQKLAQRIDEIVTEAREQVGLCEKVILLTHSMGGLVARAACKIYGAESKVLGVIHGVIPAFGAASAYWRMKAGFEWSGINPKGWLTSGCLGPTGRDVTALLANSEGGLQLLPNKHYRTNAGDMPWLRFTGGTSNPLPLPLGGDPYEEIYRVRAEPSPRAGSGASTNHYWGLVDPDLLTPERRRTPGNSLDQLKEKMRWIGHHWDDYLSYLKEAEDFHDALGDYRHPSTRRFHGIGLHTAEWIELRSESNWFQSDSYPTRGFRGFFRDARGSSMQAVLQDPAGDGDGTVPVYSATFGSNDPNPESPPDNHAFRDLNHQPAYENPEAQRWVVCAITALCKKRFGEKR
jgi:hypothetical protein